ncbi:MAG: AAA family ATPase [bacterium]|nr:AAA family ATPase [bacterium]
MTNLMIELRRSPRTLLERDGHPGPGAGQLGLVMARAGVGKTAFLVGIGIDALLSGQKVLHVALERSVDKIRNWYEDVLVEMLRREKKLEHSAALQLEIERRRHIHTYVGHSFSVERLWQAVELLRNAMEFVPDVIILDRMELEGFDPALIEGAKSLANEIEAELWMACRTHREGPQGEPGHLPPPADRFEDLVDLAFRLDPQDAKVRLHVVKDQRQMLGRDLNIVLDPQTLLLATGFSAKG